MVSIMKLHFIDTETSHLDPVQGEITEIAVITYCTETKKESCYVKKIKMLHPERANQKSLEIGNYDVDVWGKEAVCFSEIAATLSLLLKSGIIVGHNVKFDYGFLLSEFKKYNKKTDSNLKITYKTFDTKDLVFEHLYPTLKSTSMATVRDFFNWSIEGSHTALKDAVDCKNLFFSLNKCSYFKRVYYISMFKLRKFFLKKNFSIFNYIGMYL
jgi:DNA polymerase III epsilon subunit-like protein